MTDQPDDPGAEPAPRAIDKARADLQESWDNVREQLRATRAMRDQCNDEIRDLAVEEDLLRQANNVFEKRKGHR